MRRSEIIAAAYFLYLLVPVVVSTLSRPRKLRPAGITLAAAVFTCLLAALHLELMYLFCYPLVPLALGMIYRASDPRRALLANSFWSTVLLSVFVCYGLLPWIPTRPPRALEPPLPLRGMRRLNSFVLRHASVQVNTFPSGHVAAVAATIEVAPHTTSGGAAIGVVAAGIAAAAVVGRYDYLADVLLGAGVAFVAAWVGRAV